MSVEKAAEALRRLVELVETDGKWYTLSFAVKRLPDQTQMAALSLTLEPKERSPDLVIQTEAPS